MPLATKFALAAAGLVVAALACAWYGLRVLRDPALREYSHHDPFRRELEREAVVWIVAGVGLLVVAGAIAIAGLLP